MRGARIFIAVLFLPVLAAAAEPAASARATAAFAADSLPTIHPGDVATQAQWHPPAERTSFTWELGVGAGITSVGGDGGEVHSGFAPSLSLGGFVSADLALMARLSATTYTDKSGYAFQAFYGGGAQYWLIDRLFVGAGVGIATHTPSSLKSTMSVGFGGDFRAGFVIAPLPRLNLAVVVEGLPAIYGDRFVMGASLGLEFQHI